MMEYLWRSSLGLNVDFGHCRVGVFHEKTKLYCNPLSSSWFSLISRLGLKTVT